MHLDQFDQRPGQGPGVDEGDPVPVTANPRLAIDELGAGLDQMSQGGVEVGHLDGDVMQPLATPVQESTDRGIAAERHQQLQVRAPQRNHRLLDPLVGHDLATQRLDAEQRRQRPQRLIEVTHGDGGVVQVDRKHLDESSDTGRWQNPDDVR